MNNSVEKSGLKTELRDVYYVLKLTLTGPLKLSFPPGLQLTIQTFLSRLEGVVSILGTCYLISKPGRGEYNAISFGGAGRGFHNNTNLPNYHGWMREGCHINIFGNKK